MAAEVLRLGGVARLDPDPERELATWRDDLGRGALDDPAETRQRLAEQEAGDAVIVEVALFADVADDEKLRRVDGIEVPGLWFQRGYDEQNRAHVREIVADRLDELCADLRGHGVAATVEELEQLPIKVELADELTAALGS